jgi:hypothetical protein
MKQVTWPVTSNNLCQVTCLIGPLETFILDRIKKIIIYLVMWRGTSPIKLSHFRTNFKLIVKVVQMLKIFGQSLRHYAKTSTQSSTSLYWVLRCNYLYRIGHRSLDLLEFFEEFPPRPNKNLYICFSSSLFRCNLMTRIKIYLNNSCLLTVCIFQSVDCLLGANCTFKNSCSNRTSHLL